MRARTTTEIVVVDASVLVELVIDGQHRTGADALLDRIAAPAGLTLITAAHGLVEAVSALRRFARAGALDVTDGAQAVRWLGALDVVLDAAGPRLPRIWELRDRMSAYDAAYAACADALGEPLITTDARLLDACEQAGVPAAPLRTLAAG